MTAARVRIANMPVFAHRPVTRLRSLAPALLVLLVLAYQALVPHGFMPGARANTLELSLSICNPHRSAAPISLAVQTDEPAGLHGGSGFCPYCPLFAAIDPPARLSAVQIVPAAELALPAAARTAAPVASRAAGPPLGSRAPPLMA